MRRQNYNVYKLGAPGNAATLTHRATVLAASPEDAAMQAVKEPGKYAVTDLNFTEIHRVDLNLRPV